MPPTDGDGAHAMSIDSLEAQMHFAWGELEELTFELAKRNGSDLEALRKRITSARSRGLAILKKHHKP